MAGGFAAIKDVPKIKVYELARLRNNKGAKAIPVSMIKRVPKAGIPLLGLRSFRAPLTEIGGFRLQIGIKSKDTTNWLHYSQKYVKWVG